MRHAVEPLFREFDAGLIFLAAIVAIVLVTIWLGVDRSDRDPVEAQFDETPKPPAPAETPEEIARKHHI